MPAGVLDGTAAGSCTWPAHRDRGQPDEGRAAVCGECSQPRPGCASPAARRADAASIGAATNPGRSAAHQEGGGFVGANAPDFPFPQAPQDDGGHREACQEHGGQQGQPRRPVPESQPVRHRRRNSAGCRHCRLQPRGEAGQPFLVRLGSRSGTSRPHGRQHEVLAVAGRESQQLVPRRSDTLLKEATSPKGTRRTRRGPIIGTSGRSSISTASRIDRPAMPAQRQPAHTGRRSARTRPACRAPAPAAARARRSARRRRSRRPTTRGIPAVRREPVASCDRVPDGWGRSCGKCSVAGAADTETASSLRL